MLVLLLPFLLSASPHADTLPLRMRVRLGVHEALSSDGGSPHLHVFALTEHDFATLPTEIYGAFSQEAKGFRLVLSGVSQSGPMDMYGPAEASWLIPPVPPGRYRLTVQYGKKQQRLSLTITDSTALISGSGKLALGEGVTRARYPVGFLRIRCAHGDPSPTPTLCPDLATAVAAQFGLTPWQVPKASQAPWLPPFHTPDTQASAYEDLAFVGATPTTFEALQRFLGPWTAPYAGTWPAVYAYVQNGDGQYASCQEGTCRTQ